MKSQKIRQVRLFKPSVGEEELEAIRAVFERSWLGLGPCVSAFEEEWSSYIGATSSLAVNSGTAALHLALGVFDFPPGSKVFVPAITFVSSAAAVLYNGLEPVFVDIVPETLSMDLDDLESKLTSDCVAVVAVHMGGHPVDMVRLGSIAQVHQLKIIEDCAHACGSDYLGKKLGMHGDIGCFSFEEKKGMTTGDGGMISSNDPALIESLRAVRWCGIDKDTWRRNAGYTQRGSTDARHWHYEVASLGYKYNMNDLSASIGRVQLRKLDAMNRRRSDLISRYMRGLEGIDGLVPLLPYQPDAHAYWLFGVRNDQRDALIVHLKAHGVATGVHYMPLPLHPLFSTEISVACPVALESWTRWITLPLFADMLDEEVDYVLHALALFNRA